MFIQNQKWKLAMTKNVFKRKKERNVKIKYSLLLLIQLIHLLWFKFQCLPTVSSACTSNLLLSFYYLIYILLQLFVFFMPLLYLFLFRSAIVNWVTSKHIKIRERNKFSFLFFCFFIWWNFTKGWDVTGSKGVPVLTLQIEICIRKKFGP